RKAKAKNNQSNTIQHNNCSNPQRRDQRSRKRRRAQYDYELSQYYFYNRRKVVARKVLGKENSDVKCSIPINEVENHFKQVLETSNDRVLDFYPSRDIHDDIVISLEDVELAIKTTNLDSAPGPDKVLVRTVRDLKVARIIKQIVDISLATGTFPKILQVGRTIL
ncbi:hypothetical protein BLA29_012967, partial [Euroglyphus maynei]